MTKREQEGNDAFLKSTNAKKNDDSADKVCEWLRNNWREYVYQDKDGVICFGHWENDLRKAMEL